MGHECGEAALLGSRGGELPAHSSELLETARAVYPHYATYDGWTGISPMDPKVDLPSLRPTSERVVVADGVASSPAPGDDPDVHPQGLALSPLLSPTIYPNTRSVTGWRRRYRPSSEDPYRTELLPESEPPGTAPLAVRRGGTRRTARSPA